jgi:hypothetical protein
MHLDRLARKNTDNDVERNDMNSLTWQVAIMFM